jgi:hypothetical protein
MPQAFVQVVRGFSGAVAASGTDGRAETVIFGRLPTHRVWT